MYYWKPVTWTNNMRHTARFNIRAPFVYYSYAIGSKTLQSNVYADDTMLYRSGKDPREMCHGTINEDLERVRVWLLRNYKLHLNMKKAEYNNYFGNIQRLEKMDDDNFDIHIN